MSSHRQEKKIDAISSVVDFGMGELDAAPQGDSALAYAHNIHEHQQISPKMNKILRWKADIFVTTLLALVYLCQFADKTSNSGASIIGIRESKDAKPFGGLDMTKDRYSWVGTSFYIGELFGLTFMWALVQRFPVAKFTAVLLVAWGIVMVCSAACQSFAGYIVCRVLLGMLESAVTPAFSHITSQWYRRDSGEQFSRTCFWFGANGLGNILAISISYGFYIRENSSIAPWRGLLITLGCMTIFLGLIFFFHIPDEPTKAWFLTEDEKLWQVERIRGNKKGFGSHVIKTYQIAEAFKDTRYYLYCSIMFLACVTNGGISSFSSLIVKGVIKNNGAYAVGKGPRSGDINGQTLLYNLPQGAVEFGGCFLTGIAALYCFKNTRMAYGIFTCFVSILALCMLAWGPNTGSNLFGIYGIAWSLVVVMICLLSSIQSNTGGTTKSMFTTASFMMFYAGGNALGGSKAIFKAAEAPGYHTGKVTMASVTCVLTVLTICLLIINIVANRLRDKEGGRVADERCVDSIEFADLTDFENPDFRYAY